MIECAQKGCNRSVTKDSSTQEGWQVMATYRLIDSGGAKHRQFCGRCMAAIERMIDNVV